MRVLNGCRDIVIARNDPRFVLWVPVNGVVFAEFGEVPIGVTHRKIAH